ncbi:MAG: hypothetical protein V4699_00805 [Patescibacteria group bacterium]
MKDPKSILLLLHEIGHLYYNGRRGKNKNKKLDLVGLLEQHNDKEDKDIRKRLVELISEEERTAWSEGLMIARRLKKEKGFNLLEGFESLSDLQDIMHSALMVYRLGVGDTMIIGDEGVWRHIWVKIKEKVGLKEENYGKEQWEFLKNLFDKDKLKRN